MQFTRTNINKTFRNGVVNTSNVAVTNVGGGGGSSSLSGNFLPAVNNGDGSYTVDLSKVLFTGSVISEGEVTAYGSSDGSGSTTTGGVTIIDGLDSVATDCALSANQGRILKELIDNTAGGATALAKLTDVSLSSLTNGQILKYDAVLKKWVNGTLDNTKVTWANIEGKPAELTEANIIKWNELAKNNHTHSNKATLDKITETDITNWNDANSKKHSHSNKTVLDGITSTKVTGWDGVVTNWNKAFYFDSNGDLKVKVNVIGEKEVSTYGAGSSGSGGSITIVDALTSTATDAALSANQGRILKELIDNFSSGGVSSWNDLTDKPSWITNTKPSYSWSEIGDKPSTFTPSTHTHNYASTVKIGSTNYNVSGNTISLPAYPTVPSALRNPNALTISLNGTSQGAYDGSAAKSINITASGIGAAPSSHNHNSSYVSALGTSGNYLTWTKNGTANNITVPYATNADTVDGYHHTAFNMGWTASTKYRVDRWGGGTDLNWKKIVTYVNTGGGQYQSCKVKGTIYYITGNHNQGHVIDIPFEVVMYAYGGTANSILNQSTLYLPSYCTWDLIRIVRYANNSWEVQVRQPSDWTNISLEYTVTNNGGSVSAGQFANTTYTSSTVANSYNTNVSRPTSSRCSSADKVNSTLSFTAGSFGTKSFDGSSNQTVNIPTHTSHLTNNSGFITSSATVAAANKVTNTLTFTGYQSKSFNGSAAVSVAIPNNTNQLTNGAGYITSSASISGNAATATKLQTARTINGTSFNGTANITTANWGSTRSIYIQDATATNTSSAVSVNGGGNAYLKLPTNLKVGTLTATGEVTAYSDIRLKTNIKPLENRGYITPVTYKKDGKDSIGFIAQEVRGKYPELVAEDDSREKYLSLNYAQYVAVLQAQIIELNNRIKQLEEWHYQTQE